MNNQEQFLNKKVDVQQIDDFHLYGIIVSFEQHGIWLKTQRETSFITYQNIKQIRLDRRG